VYSINVTDNCAGYYEILNLSLKDEKTLVYANLTSPNEANIEIDLSIMSKTNSSKVINFNKTWTGENNVSICINPDILNFSSYRIDFTIGFDATDHVWEFYYMDNGTLDKSSYFNSYTYKNINLLDLLSADSTTFLFTYTDENNQEVRT
jgi:hypothetical protein